MKHSPISFAALLTTGPSPADDRIVQVAAVRVTDGEVVDRVEQTANPGELSNAERAVTGLTDGDLAGKPTPSEALRALYRFAEGGTIAVYDAVRFGRFAEAAGAPAPDCLDVQRLALIARPARDDYSFRGIAASLGLEPVGQQRAAAKALLLARLWEALLEGLTRLPGPVLDLICRIAEAARDPLAPVLAEGAARGGELDLAPSHEAALEELFRDNSELLRRAQRHQQGEAGEEPLPVDAICRMLDADGLVSRRLPGYEIRPEQVEMARAVCEALNEPHHLMVEAGTGTGKSLAYLIPAIAWAATNGDRVVVSTNTRNLQEQLYRKDLPFLAELLPGRFEAAQIKGRRNYLCVRRFVHLARQFERELSGPDEFMALAPLAVWAASTQSGDLSECNGFFLSPGAPAVLTHVTTGPGECAGRACPLRRRCFVGRARTLAQLADVIVANHALVFSDLGLDQPVLPPYRIVVFDEAHNVEDVATEAASTAVDTLSFFRTTNFLYRPRRDGSGSGLLATVMHQAERARVACGEPIMEACGAAMEAVDGVVEATKQFFELLAAPFEELPRHVERMMLRECEPDVGPGSEAWQAAQQLRASVRELGERIEKLACCLERAEADVPEATTLAADLRAQAARLREGCDAVEFVLKQEEESYVYWLERTTRERRTFHSLHAAPLEVGQFIRRSLLDEKRCVIFTSATLQVDGQFDYMRQRLGAASMPPGRMRCLAVGSPFDYDRQALVGVATFLPDPGGRRDRTYDAELSSFLIDLLKCTRGRALVLFTSYSLLESVYEVVREPLGRAGILVLAQGHSGSREAVTHMFRSVTSSVLLGTRSFWEGVDISGEALSCLVMTKLPFHVFTDPLVRGRIERLRQLGQEPFRHYTLPEAVISFRQGFGRLIRSRSDVGVILVTDRRLATRGYGRSFLNSLPTRHRVFRTRQEALRAVSRFFERAGPQTGRASSSAL